MTVFQIIVGDYMSGALAKPFLLYEKAGVTIGKMMQDLISGQNAANGSNMTISVTGLLSDVIYPVDYNCEFLTLKAHLDKIQEVMRGVKGTTNPWSDNLGFLCTTEGQTLSCFFGGDNTSDGKLIKYVSSPPRNEGGSFSFIAPWDMSLRTNDVLQIPNSFARQSFGGFVATPTGGSGVTKKWILSVAFDFSTTQATNKMNVKCLYTGPGQ